MELVKEDEGVLEIHVDEDGTSVMAPKTTVETTVKMMNFMSHSQ